MPVVVLVRVTPGVWIIAVMVAEAHVVTVTHRALVDVFRLVKAIVKVTVMDVKAALLVANLLVLVDVITAVRVVVATVRKDVEAIAEVVLENALVVLENVQDVAVALATSLQEDVLALDAQVPVAKAVGILLTPEDAHPAHLDARVAAMAVEEHVLVAVEEIALVRAFRVIIFAITHARVDVMQHALVTVEVHAARHVLAHVITSVKHALAHVQEVARIPAKGVPHLAIANALLIALVVVKRDAAISARLLALEFVTVAQVVSLHVRLLRHKLHLVLRVRSHTPEPRTIKTLKSINQIRLKYPIVSM